MSHLGHVTRTVYTKFIFRILRSLHLKYEFNWPIGFRREGVENVAGRTDAGVKDMLPAHPRAFGSGEFEMRGVETNCQIHLISNE